MSGLLSARTAVFVALIAALAVFYPHLRNDLGYA